jgi:hypothetical protein
LLPGFVTAGVTVEFTTAGVEFTIAGAGVGVGGGLLKGDDGQVWPACKSAMFRLLPFAQLRTGAPTVELFTLMVKLLGGPFAYTSFVGVEPIANTATVTTTAMLIENFIRSVLIVL